MPSGAGAGTVGAEMYRFLLAPKWIGFHLLVLVGIVAMLGFSQWQFDRLDTRRAFNDRLESRVDEPARPIDELIADSGGDVDAIEWRQAEATGRYLPDEQVLVVNRSQNGRPGDNVVTPMALAGGRILLVNRGFVPLGVDVPAPPSGTVAVRGIVRPSQERRTGQLSDPAEGELREVQRLDIERLAPQLPGPVLPVAIDLLESTPSESGGVPEPVIRPDLSDGPHLSYAVQWIIFAIAVAVGWVLAVRRSISRHRLDLSSSDDGRAEPGEVGAEPVTVGRDAPTPGGPPSRDAAAAAAAPPRTPTA